MAEISLKVKAELDKAQADFKALGATVDMTEKQFKKLQNQMSEPSIDKFIQKSRVAGIAMTAAKGATAGLTTEMSKLQNEMNRLLKASLDPMSPAIVKLKTRIAELQGQLPQTKGAMSGFGSSLSMVAGVLASSAIANKIYDIGKASLMAASDMQQNQIAFKTMLQSASAATDILNQITEFAAKTPFNKNELIGYAKGMIGVGFATKDIIPTMEMLGNIAAGVGQEKLPNIVKAFDKMKAKGKASLEELWPIVEAGVPILDQLAKDLGKSKDEVIKMATNGKLGFEQVQSSLKKVELEKFNGLMNELTVTFGGKLSNFNDQLDMTAVIIGNKMMPAANTWLDLASNILSSLNESGDSTESSFSKVLGYATDIFVPVKGISAAYTWIAEKANEYLFTTDKQVAATWEMNKAIEQHKQNVLAIAEAYIKANGAQGGGVKPTPTGGGGTKKSETQIMQDQLVKMAGFENEIYAQRVKAAEDFYTKKAEAEVMWGDSSMQWQFDQASLIAANDKLTFDQKLAAMKALEKATQKNSQAILKNELQFGGQILGSTSDLMTNIQTIMQNSGKESKKMAYALKALAMAQAGINTALAVTKTLADGGPFPLNVINAAIIGAAGAAQVAAIATTPIKAETGLQNYTVPDIRSNRNDSAPIMAQGGETVSITPRGEDSSQITSVNISIGETQLFSIIQRGINTGQINVSNKNVGAAVFAR